MAPRGAGAGLSSSEPPLSSGQVHRAGHVSFLVPPAGKHPSASPEQPGTEAPRTQRTLSPHHGHETETEATALDTHVGPQTPRSTGWGHQKQNKGAWEGEAEDDAGQGAGLRGPCHMLARSRRSYPGPKNEIQGSLNSTGKTQELRLVSLQNAPLPLRQVEAAKASSVALCAAGPGASARLAMEGVLKPQSADDCVAHSTSTCC